MEEHDLEEILEDTPFRVDDPAKRSRFQTRDLTKLMLIVTRRKPYAAPYGKGDAEWQAVANDLNAAVKAYLQLKTRFEEKRHARFEEKRHAEAEKKKRKKKRIATAGSKAMR
ncbi:hypothetical protein GN958_ATG00271, partial [Phytophthora infestans]